MSVHHLEQRTHAQMAYQELVLIMEMGSIFVSQTRESSVAARKDIVTSGQ
jgi:hypothetical protein